jgi:hypothetical protein
MLSLQGLETEVMMSTSGDRCEESNADELSYTTAAASHLVARMGTTCRGEQWRETMPGSARPRDRQGR